MKTANVAKIVNAEKMVKNANAGKNVLAAIIANAPKKINVNAEKMVKNANAGKNVLAAIIANAPKKINAAILATAAIINR